MNKQVASQATQYADYDKLVKQFGRMVMKIAWRTWYRLPQQTRVWINIEDVIEDGMWWASRFAAKHYRSDWKGKFITQLYHSVHNYLYSEYIDTYTAQFRGWHRVNGMLKPIPHKSIEGMQAALDKSNPTLDDVVGTIPALVVNEDSIIQNMQTECFVVPVLIEIYKAASPKLQNEIINWFWHRRSRVANKGKFKRLSKEFREMCKKEGLTCDDCIHIIRSPKCLDSLSRELFWVPFDLDNPTPGLGNNIW